MTSFRAQLNRVFSKKQRNQDVLAEEIVSLFDALDAEAKERLMPVRNKLKVLLAKMAGCRFGSVNESRAVASRVQAFMSRWNFRLRPNKWNDNDMCMLYCSVAGRDKQASFNLRSIRNAKAVTSRTFPGDILVEDAPPDARRKSYLP